MQHVSLREREACRSQAGCVDEEGAELFISTLNLGDPNTDLVQREGTRATISHIFVPFRYV